MAYRRDVFCEIAFLEELRDATLVPYSDAEIINRNVYLFAQKANLKLDVANEKELATHCKKMEGAEQNMHTSDLIFRLAKQHTQGVKKLSFSDEHQMPHVKYLVGNVAERVKYTYLLNKKEAVCKSYRENYGVVVLSPDCWKTQAQKHQYLFGDCGQSLKRWDKVDWPGIFKAEHNLSQCNAMVIIDNHIFNDVEKGLGHLRRIFDVLLPKKLSDEFHVTILTAKNRHNENRNDEELQRAIKNCIRELREDLKFKIDLYVDITTSSNENHDRYILTNNVRIVSGKGFGIINPDRYGNLKANANTTISILHPGIQSFAPMADDDYLKVLRTNVYEKVVHCTTQGQWLHYPTGESCTNRLILSMGEERA